MISITHAEKNFNNFLCIVKIKPQIISIKTRREK